MLVVFHEGPMDGVVVAIEDWVREVEAVPGATIYHYTGERVLVGTAAWAMEFKPEGAL